MNRHYLIASIIVIGILAPLFSLAAEFDYARVIEHTDTEVLIKRNSLSEEVRYRCTIETRACNAVNENTSILPPGSNATPPYLLAYRALMPVGASSLHRSPDGRYIAFYVPATASRGARTFGVMDTTDLSIYTRVEKVAYWDLLSESLLRYYHFSPGSKTLIYLDDVKDYPTMYKVNMVDLKAGDSTLPAERLFSKEYSVTDVVWKDNNTIYYIANRDNPYAWALYQLNINTYNLKKIAENVSYADNLWIKGDTLLFAQNDEKGLRPALYNMKTGTIEYFNLPVWASEKTSGKVVNLKGGLSGIFLLEESGWSDTLVVWLHGGPYRQASAGYHPYQSYGGYDWMLEKLTRADVGVLKLDYPGSAGFGRVFAESITGGIGTVDSEKAGTAIKDFATRNSYKNIYVIGNSYGGYLALKLLVDQPGLIDGAFSINGVADWLTLLTKLDTSIFNVQFHGTVDDTNRDSYQRASIYNYADRITNQKVILMHGGEDRSIPYAQSEGLATYLSLIGKTVQYIKLEGEDHVYKKPESFETLCKTAFVLANRANNTACEL